MLAIAAGCDSLWMPDHLIAAFPDSIWQSKYVGGARLADKANAFYEPWTVLGYLAARNRVARKRLGVAVTDAGRRNPAVTAQAAASLHLLSRGRAILGIGPGEREGNEPYGVDWSKPVARFVEAVATIRFLWDSDGEPVSRDSEYFPLHDAVFDVPPYKGTRPEIWIGAHGPRMLRATGQYGDAWFPAFPQLPTEYAEKLDLVRSAASDAGRDPSAVLPAAYFWMLVGRSPAEVDELMGAVVPRAMSLAAPAGMWKRHGVEHPLGPTFSGLQDLLPQTIDEETALAYAKLVPPSLLREVFVVGTPDEILEQMAERRDHGVRYAVAMNLSPMHPSLRTGLGASVPFLRVLRGLRRL
ncbi:phthiodiolone/phenolphthiodiolone dimycocerosates ketoreductase [Nocardia rhizosphaerihabitans]|uniref:Phthiodiolone/phenolphthiodiolone dimycocerosates ketoreductase n=2 Tax=Nocardia rhizosphaerihabitans TaxID=1691570 RepID=A0ABQ2KJT3_9NOCA|nr:LLM class flavin-dependent oxidoreductase [Nocardia rhizosphaerihabitans]GGN81764.1 phthiodiolone/phenolphthiodiolone dimycocerosates ketoreductase [Nocardia rhizosphaerihabitans]